MDAVVHAAAPQDNRGTAKHPAKAGSGRKKRWAWGLLKGAAVIGTGILVGAVAKGMAGHSGGTSSRR